MKLLQRHLGTFLILLVISNSFVYGVVNTYEPEFDLVATCDNDNTVLMLLQCNFKLHGGDISGTICDVSLCRDNHNNGEVVDIEQDCFETIEDIQLDIDITRTQIDDSDNDDPNYGWYIDHTLETDTFENVGYEYVDATVKIDMFEFNTAGDDPELVIEEANIECNYIEEADNPIIVGGSSEQRTTIVCVDLHGWTDSFDDDCYWYKRHDEPGCPLYGNFYIPDDRTQANYGIAPNFACCYCQQGTDEAGQRTTPQCYDIVGWEDRDGDDCSWYEVNDDLGCPRYGGYYTQNDPDDPYYDISSQAACCYCRTTTSI